MVVAEIKIVIINLPLNDVDLLDAPFSLLSFEDVEDSFTSSLTLTMDGTCVNGDIVVPSVDGAVTKDVVVVGLAELLLEVTLSPLVVTAGVVPTLSSRTCTMRLPSNAKDAYARASVSPSIAV